MVHNLADFCVNGAGCHHFTGHQGTFIFIVVIGLLVTGFLMWKKP